MKKQLILMRHAKADRDEKRWADFDRPLSDRGLRDAQFMGRWLFDQKFKIDHVLASPSLRTLETARLVSEQIHYTQPIDSPRSLYEGSSREYLLQIGLTSASIHSLLVIGHNPALEQLIERLTSEWVTLKTAGVAYLRYTGMDWSDLKSDRVELIDVWSPKTIAEK